MQQDMNNPKEERKKMEKVISGTAKKKKRSGLARLSDIFAMEDVRDVKKYIFEEALIPKIKQTFVDIVMDGVNMWCYGNTKNRRDSGSSTYVSYDTRYRYDDRYDYRSNSDFRPYTGFDIGNITLDSKGDADEVIRQLNIRIRDYGVVTVAELYEAVGWPSQYTDCKYGWMSLRNAESVRTRDGRYALRLPKVVPID